MIINEDYFKPFTEKYYSDHPCIQPLVATPTGRATLYVLDSLYSYAVRRWKGGRLMIKGKPLTPELYSENSACDDPGFIRMCFRIFQQAGVLYKNDDDQWCLIDLEQKPVAKAVGR